MKELLQEELAAGVAVTIRGKDYKLAFPIGAVILYKKHTGESLFKFSSWIKPGPEGTAEGASLLIGPDDDPEKFLFALHAGIYGGQLLAGHRGQPDPALLPELQAGIDVRNADPLTSALIKALLAFLVPNHSQAEDSGPLPKQAENVS